MKARCYNKNNQHYLSYGGRGIKICDEWRNEENGFDNFADWAISNGYTDELSIERVDVNGDYEPKNCTWITMDEQSTNKQNTIWVEYQGERIQLLKLCKRLNLNYKRVYDRIFVQEMSLEDAINTPVGGADNLFRRCREIGIDCYTIRARIQSGWDEERALNTPIRHWKKPKNK